MKHPGQSHGGGQASIGAQPCRDTHGPRRMQLRRPERPVGRIVGIYERQLHVTDGTWSSTLPSNPHPGLEALFGELDAGTLEMWEGIDGVYRIYEPGTRPRLVAELSKHDEEKWYPESLGLADREDCHGDETRNRN